MKPLLTFVIAAYKQERFIAQAVEGALSQDYSPLEIILSDDCSPDKTFEIMEGMAKSYRGPHDVRLNRMARNSGLAAHINQIQGMARGELFLAGAGDDISLPERARVLCEAWESTGRKVSYLHSRVIHIDDEGRRIRHPLWEFQGEPTNAVVTQSATPASYVESLHPEVLGCAGAWTPELFKVFGPLPLNVIHEDNVVVLRGLMKGGVAFVNRELVQYRLHDANSFNARQDMAWSWRSVQDHEQRLRRMYTNRATMYAAFCSDLARARELGLISESECVSALAAARKQEKLFALQSSFLVAGPVKKMVLLLELARVGATGRQLRKMLVRVPPAALFGAAKLAYSWGRRRSKPRSSGTVASAA